jgi:hypothetical protein
MKHTEYGVRHICTENGVNTGHFPIEQWFGTDIQGKSLAENEVSSYVELNEKCIKENLPTRHEIYIISREVENKAIEGTLSIYDNEQCYDDNVNYIAITNEEGDSVDVDSIFDIFIGHKVRITVEYID